MSGMSSLRALLSLLLFTASLAAPSSRTSLVRITCLRTRPCALTGTMGQITCKLCTCFIGMHVDKRVNM